MTQQRSNEAIRADVRYLNDHEAQTGRRSSAHVLLTHDVEPLLARAERAEAQVRAIEAFCAEREAVTGSLGERVARDLRGLIAAAGSAGLSLQEEQPTHLVGAGGWRACDTAADWAGSDTTGVTCAECLATTTDALLQEEQE